MRVFLLDLWLDLRAKRLAPVAILLLAAIIVVPIVLAKGSNNEPTTTATTGTTGPVAPATPVVQSNPDVAVKASRLGTFSPKDPFQPTRVVVATTGTAAATGTTGGTGTTETTPTTTSESGGGTTSTGTTGATTPETKTTLFTYTVDLRFGPPGDEALHKGVQRLELIPDAQDPKIVFLGVTTSGKTAVFLVDSSLGVDSSGKCKPSADQCTFLYMRPDGDHDQAELTDQDGNTFRLHLLHIHRITITSSTSGGGSNQSGSSNRSPAFTGSAGSHSDNTQTGDAPAGEPSQPFQFSGFFSDSEGGQ